MRTVLPGFATISEFANQLGLTGDCGPTATLAALHSVDPARWPLTPAALKALDADEIAHGFAEANGAQNIPSLSSYLDRLGVAHTTHGYNACPLDLVHSTLKSLAGSKPVLVEIGATVPCQGLYLVDGTAQDPESSAKWRERWTPELLRASTH